jgi:hypothetical protein
MIIAVTVDTRMYKKRVTDHTSMKCSTAFCRHVFHYVQCARVMWMRGRACVTVQVTTRHLTRHIGAHSESYTACTTNTQHRVPQQYESTRLKSVSWRVMYGLPGGWMHGLTDWQMDDWMHGLADWQVDYWMHGLTDGLKNRWTTGCTDWLIDHWTTGCTDWLTDGLKDRWGTGCTDWLTDGRLDARNDW